MRTNYAVGVDVGGTRIAAGLVERKGRIVKDAKRLTPKTGPFAVVDAIIDLVEEVSAGRPRLPRSPASASAFPRRSTSCRQSVEFCTNLPLAGVDVRSLVMSRTKREVTIDNDGHLAALGESRYGAAKGARDFLMITLGTGVGGGMFVDGEPYRGSRGLGGEIGHMVVDLDGPPCPCGGDGHLEAFLGRPAIAARGQGGGQGVLTGARSSTPPAATLDDDHRRGGRHRRARAATGRARDPARVRRGARPRARRLRQHASTPSSIVVGGGIGESADFLVERAAEVMQGEALAGAATCRSSRRFSATTRASWARRRSRSTSTTPEKGCTARRRTRRPGGSHDRRSHRVARRAPAASCGTRQRGKASSIGDDVLDYIAGKYALATTLKGALINVQALASRKGVPVTLSSRAPGSRRDPRVRAAGCAA